MGAEAVTQMDRRSFVHKAGLVTAGSAFGLLPMGCAADQVSLYVPCDSRVDAPTPVPGMKYIQASQIGCALDCDLSTGLNIKTGGAATDDAPLINAAMAAASASNPITLIVDGGALISGLFLPAGGYWSIAGLGCGTGFFIQSGTNNDGIHNGNATAAVPSDPGPFATLPARGNNVSLSNFTVNGNAGNGMNGNSTTGLIQGTATADLWYYCINLMNLNNITIDNVVVVNAPAYHFRLSNVGNVVVTGCTMRSFTYNTDGLHFDGPANDIHISNCSFTTGDDAVALNCPEGYSGNISRVTVTNCTFNSLTLMRLYTINANNSPFTFNIDTVTVSHCNGTLSQTAFLIGQGKGSNPNSIAALSVLDCNLTTPAVLDLEANFGVISLTRVTMTPNSSYFNDGYAFARTSSAFIGMTYIGSSLVLNNCNLARNGDYPVAALILESGSTIQDIEFNGFAVQDPAGNAYAASPELINIVSGTIGQMVIDSVDSTHVSAVVSAGGFASVGSVSGAGVLATDWQFPDTVMANGTPYLSANSGKSSIKVGGVVQPYP